MLDAAGNAVIPWSPLFPVNNSRLGDSCSAQLPGTDVNGPQRSAAYPNGLKVASISDCCAACNGDKTCVNWVYADPSSPDPSGMNCWPLQAISGFSQRTGRTTGGANLPRSLTLAASASAQFYGRGTGYGDATQLTKTSSQPNVRPRGKNKKEKKKEKKCRVNWF